MAGIGRMQCSNQHPERVRAGRGAQSRKGQSGKRRNGSGLWKALRLRRFEVDHEADHGDRFVGEAAQPESADLDQARQHFGRPHQQATVDSLDVYAIVADEPRERQPACLDERKGEPRFSRT